MSMLYQDLKYAARRLRRTPVFTIFAVALLAIGIGLNVVVFGLVDALLLRPAPFADPERVIHIYQDSDSGTPSSTAFPAYRDMATMTNVFAAVSATTAAEATWETPDGPRNVSVQFATASLFPTLGLSSSRGRWFDAEHDHVGAEMVAVVSDVAWRARFGADPGVVGRTIRLNNQAVTIIGVGPRDFNGQAGALTTDFWLSISSVPIGGPFRVANLERREDHWYTVMARLAPGVRVENARGALQSLATRHAEENPDLDRGRDITLFTYDQVRLPRQATLMTGVSAFVVAAVVLLLVCSNLANPPLAADVRERRNCDSRALAVIARGRTPLLEALLLSALGGAIGLGAASWFQAAVSALPLAPNGGGLDVRIDYRLVAFSALAALGTSLLFGLLPSRRSATTDVAAALRNSGRGQSAGRGASLLRGGLVAVQVALSVVLVAATGLLARSLVNAERVDPGVDAERVAVISTNLQQAGVTTQDEAIVVAAQILERVAALPGVENAALTTRLPLTPGGTSSTVVEGYEPATGTNAVEMPSAGVSRGYFATMGIRLVAGRTFSEVDRPGSPAVVVVNETAARLFFGGDAINRRVRPQSAADAWREVIGVVADTKVNEITEQPTPMMYFSQEQVGAPAFAVVARTSGDAAARCSALCRARCTTFASRYP
jgi:predicted permease